MLFSLTMSHFSPCVSGTCCDIVVMTDAGYCKDSGFCYLPLKKAQVLAGQHECVWAAFCTLLGGFVESPVVSRLLRLPVLKFFFSVWPLASAFPALRGRQASAVCRQRPQECLPWNCFCGGRIGLLPVTLPQLESAFCQRKSSYHYWPGFAVSQWESGLQAAAEL
jgi:hypothetical protein